MAAVVANVFTLSRIVLTPLIAWAILNNRYVAAIAVFVLAGVTDVLDGALARKLGAVSRFGAWADPVADKVLLVSAYLALGAAAALPWWLVGLVLGRDVLILALAGAVMAFTPLREFPPSRWGKLSTFAQILTAAAAMASQAWPSAKAEATVGGLGWATAWATVWSGAHYFWSGGRRVWRWSRAAP